MFSEMVNDRKCAICGTANTFIEITLLEKPKFFDLDSRPPEPYRSSMEHWVQCCEKCRYCMPNIEEIRQGAEAIVSNDDYQKKFRSSLYPDLANKFICYGNIEERLGRWANAGWAYLHAAWACDDRRHEGASELRKKAIELFEKALLNHEEIIDQRGGPGVLIIDTLRRAKEFDRAWEYCHIGLKKDEDPMIDKLIKFENLLIKKKDAGRYTVDDGLTE